MDYEQAFKIAVMASGGLAGWLLKDMSRRLVCMETSSSSHGDCSRRITNLESEVKGHGDVFTQLKVAIAELTGEVRGLRKQLSKDSDAE